MKHLIPTLLIGAAAFGFTTTTFAADLIIDEPTEVGVVEAAPGSWDGVFLGGFVGGAGGTGTSDEEEPSTCEECISLFVVDSSAVVPPDLSGWLAGVNLGANFTVADGIVAGVVGDIAWSNITDGDLVDINWTGSLRGRLGFDGGSFMPYLTAGLAVAGVNYDGEGQTHLGWTAGAGVEFAVSEDVSLDLLYRYSDYAPVDYLAVTGLDLNTHQVTVGLNWRF